MPLATIVAGGPELIGDARAANHRHGLVYQQQLTVIAVQVAQAATPAQAIIETQFDTGLDQPSTQPQSKSQAAKVIKQAAHPHSTLGRLDQRLDHGLGALAGLHQIQLKLDLTVGPGNRHQHARKEIRTVDQQLEGIVAAPGKDRAGHVSAP